MTPTYVSAYLREAMLDLVCPPESPESARIVDNVDKLVRAMVQCVGIERTKTWAQELDSIAESLRDRLSPIAYAILIDSLES